MGRYISRYKFIRMEAACRYTMSYSIIWAIKFVIATQTSLLTIVQVGRCRQQAEPSTREEATSPQEKYLDSTEYAKAVLQTGSDSWADPSPHSRVEVVLCSGFWQSGVSLKHAMVIALYHNGINISIAADVMHAYLKLMIFDR